LGYRTKGLGQISAEFETEVCYEEDVYSKQKARTVRTCHELGSYSATLRLLGYLSRHALFEWARSPALKPKPRGPEGPAKRYTWETGETAVLRVMGGDGIRGVATDLGITNGAAVYEWVRRWRIGRCHGFVKHELQKSPR